MSRPPTSSTAPKKYYKPFLIRNPSLLFFLVLNLTLLVLVELAFQKIPSGAGDGIIGKTINTTLGGMGVGIGPAPGREGSQNGNNGTANVHGRRETASLVNLQRGCEIYSDFAKANRTLARKHVVVRKGMWGWCLNNCLDFCLGYRDNPSDCDALLARPSTPPSPTTSLLDPTPPLHRAAQSPHCWVCFYPSNPIGSTSGSSALRRRMLRGSPRYYRPSLGQHNPCCDYGNNPHECMNFIKSMKTEHPHPLAHENQTLGGGEEGIRPRHERAEYGNNLNGFCGEEKKRGTKRDHGRRLSAEAPLPGNSNWGNGHPSGDHNMESYGGDGNNPKISHRREDAAHGVTSPSPLEPITVLYRRGRYWTIPKRTYFVGAYLPILTAVLFNILWSAISASLKAMEPFCRLAAPDGATGSRSLNLKSTVSEVELVAYRVIFKSHWVVVASSAVTFIVALLVPISSEMIFVDPHATCIRESPKRTHCYGALRISVPVGRVVEAMVTVTAVLMLSITVMMWNRASGVFADPSSIAGLATLFQNEEVREEFRGLDEMAGDKEVARAVGWKRYKLGHFRGGDGEMEYGLMKCEKAQEAPEDNQEKSSSTTTTDPCKRLTLGAHRSLWLHPLSLSAFILTLMGLLTLVLYYHISRSNTGFERFMDGQGFGVSFMMTAVGVLVKWFWVEIEEETRTLEPYRELCRGNARAGDTILVRTNADPITALWSAVIRMRAFPALLGINTILAEILTIALARVPFHGDSIFMAYIVSSHLSTSILALMIATLTWLTIRQLRGVMELPRRPDTIAAVLTYLCESKMLRDFKGMAMLEARSRDRVVAKWGKRYHLRKAVGADGLARVGIEHTWSERV
ncbi:MAG: hypothetical protein M1813_000114 [Trichoglossum hirsutum]|nr:MAG: hypothetical protein M1813_000114 [Trichoglossum hirsutum]